MIDARMKRRRHTPQQPLRHTSRKRQRQSPRRTHHVASRIKRTLNQQQRRLAQHPSPKRKLLNAARSLRPRPKPLRPTPKRRPTRRQRRLRSPRNRLPPSRKIRHQDAPRHAVNTQMMNNQKQTTRSLRTSIKPNSLHHHSSRRRKSLLRRLRPLANAGLARRCIKTADVNPLNAVCRQHRSSRRNLKPPLPDARIHIRPKTQRIVMIKHSLQRTDEIILAQSRRHLQQHRLVKSIDRTPALQQPTHDRRRHYSPSGNVRQRRRRLLDQRGDPGQPGNSLMLKHRSRRDHQARFACPAHQLDRDDAVATKRKKVVLNPNPLDTQYFRKQPAKDLLLRRARQTSPKSPHMRRRRQRATIKLPVRRQRKTIKLNDRSRHHVFRQPHPNMRTQQPSINRTTSRRYHITNKLLMSPRTIIPRNNRSLRHARVRQQRCLNLPRLNPEPADLHLLVRSTHKLQNPVRAPPRQVPAAVHPSPRSTKPVRNKTLPGQPPTTQIAARYSAPRYVKLPDNPNSNRLQTIVQDVNAVIRHRPPNRNGRSSLLAFNSKSNGIDCCFGRSVKVGDVLNIDASQNFLGKGCREHLSAQRQMLQKGILRSMTNDRVQVGGHAAHKRHVMPDELMPELRRSSPYRIADDDRRSAPDKWQ